MKKENRNIVYVLLCCFAHFFSLFCSQSFYRAGERFDADRLAMLRRLGAEDDYEKEAYTCRYSVGPLLVDYNVLVDHDEFGMSLCDFILKYPELSDFRGKERFNHEDLRNIAIIIDPVYAEKDRLRRPRRAPAGAAEDSFSSSDSSSSDEGEGGAAGARATRPRRAPAVAAEDSFSSSGSSSSGEGEGGAAGARAARPRRAPAGAEEDSLSSSSSGSSIDRKRGYRRAGRAAREHVARRASLLRGLEERRQLVSVLKRAEQRAYGLRDALEDNMSIAELIRKLRRVGHKTHLEDDILRLLLQTRRALPDIEIQPARSLFNLLRRYVRTHPELAREWNRICGTGYKRSRGRVSEWKDDHNSMNYALLFPAGRRIEVPDSGSDTSSGESEEESSGDDSSS